jgi:hypothetical protein
VYHSGVVVGGFEFALLLFDTFVVRNRKNAPVNFAMSVCLATCSGYSGTAEWILLL